MKGSCLCGDVAFEIDRSSVKLYQCYCTLCRKQSGTYSNAATIVPDHAFRWVKGQAQVSSWVKDTGFRSDFCRQCGSPVPGPLRDTPFTWIPAGLLDGDVDGEIISHIYVQDKATWDTLCPNLKSHAAFPGHGLEEHIASLNREEAP